LTSEDGTELPQHVVDEIARNADRVLLPIRPDPTPAGGHSELEIALEDVPRFGLLSLSLDREGAGDLRVEEISIDGYALLPSHPAREVDARWRALPRIAGPGSKVRVRLSNPGASTVQLVGGILVAVTEDGRGHDD
jgi:hypothetical protein